MSMLYNSTKIELIRLFRNKYFIVFSILLPLAFYAIYTSTFPADMEYEGTQWKAYFLMSMTCFSLMTSSVTTMGLQLLQDRNQPWMNWLQSLPLRRWQYFISRFISLMVLNAAVITFLFVIAANWRNISLSLETWVSLGVYIWLAVIPFLALGTWISLFKNTETAAGFANIMTLGFALVGGLWMPIDQLPNVVAMIGEWTPGHLYADGAWSLLAGEGLPWVSISVLLGYFIVFLMASLWTHNYAQKG